MRILLIGLLALTLSSCTKNQRARHFGGTTKIDLPAGNKLINATWKGEDTSLWVLTRKMQDGETPETYNFKENSSWGLVEGEVIFVETK